MSRLYEILPLLESGIKADAYRAEDLKDAVLWDLLKKNNPSFSLGAPCGPTAPSPWSSVFRERLPDVSRRSDHAPRPHALYRRHLTLRERAIHSDHTRRICKGRSKKAFAVINRPYREAVDVDAMRDWLLPYGLAVLHPPEPTACTWYPGRTLMLVVLPVWDAGYWTWTPDFLDFDPAEARRVSAFERAMR